MPSRKRVLIVGGVLVTLLTISGISVAVHRDFLVGRLDASNAADLEKDLEALDGVERATVVYLPLGLPDGATDVAVAFAPDAASADWGAADALVRDAAASSPLTAGGVTVHFQEAGAATSLTVDPLPFEPATIQSEIDTWRAMREVVGDRVSLNLTFDPSSHSLLREYTVATADDARAIASTWTDHLSADSSPIFTHWTSPGMELYRVPSVREMHALLAISDVVPLIDVEHLDAHGTAAAIIGDIGTFKVSFRQAGDSPEQLGDDPPDAQLVAGVQAAVDAGASTVDWFTADHQSTLTKGECGTFTDGDGSPIPAEVHTLADDEWFLAQLIAGGLDAPDDLRAGMCTPVD
jgi:hypothetical protein